MAENETLSHAEMWDDSALVESWDAAFAEYQKYHSLALKGERVKLSQSSTKVSDKPAVVSENGTIEQKIAKAQDATATQQPPTLEQSFQAPPTTGVPSVPAALANTVQSEDLKNLMMSWYYAGYYTGLYEGKQQAMATLQDDGR